MPFTLLYIRSKQLQKELKGLGFYLVILAALACYLIVISFKQFEKIRNGYYLVAAMALLCVGLQAYRKDKLFVYKHVEKPHLQIFSEYVALTLPFAITAVFTKQWFCLPILLIILFCIPFVRFTFRQRTIFKNLSSVIHVSNFEWLSGFRKQYIAFISLYILAAVFCWFRILPLFLLWLLTVLVISFYSQCESIMILRATGKSPGKFLAGKLKIGFGSMIVLYVPLLIINTVFNSEFFLINIMFLLIQMSLLCFAICLKYSSYRPDKTQTENQILLTVVSLFAVLPYLLPVPAILSAIYFYKADNNLKNYLND